MKNGLLLGALTAAVAILCYREWMRSRRKTKCSCQDKTTTTTVMDTAMPPAAEVATTVATPSADAAVVLPMDGWGRYAGI